MAPFSAGSQSRVARDGNALEGGIWSAAGFVPPLQLSAPVRRRRRFRETSVVASRGDEDVDNAIHVSLIE
jgi:hypothetical protein